VKKSLYLGFAALGVYAFLAYSGFNGAGMPMGDLSLAYQQWVDSGFAFGLTTDWVYPYLAMLPIALANLVSPGALSWPWLIGSALVTLLVVLYVTIKDKSDRAAMAMAYYLGATLMLGPVAISRLDTLSVALAIIGVFFLARSSELTAGVWLSIATWLKVWPIALLMAAFAASKKRLTFVTFVLGVNVVILSIGFIVGADSSIFSFLTSQGGRGIQIEAPVAGIWLWPAVLGSAGTGVAYSAGMMTFEVFGPGTEVVANLMSLVQLGALAITLALGLVARRKGARVQDVIFWIGFTGILDLIVFNKVGSPQYMTWLVVPIVYGLLAGVRRINVVAVSLLFTSGLTWLIYPVFYNEILQSEVFGTSLLTLRNIVLLVGLVYANLRLQELGKKRPDDLRLDQEPVVAKL
jgi:hypothetical protein